MSFSLGWVLCLSLRVDTALTLDISLEWCGSFMSSIFFLSFYIVLFSSQESKLIIGKLENTERYKKEKLLISLIFKYNVLFLFTTVFKKKIHTQFLIYSLSPLQAAPALQPLSSKLRPDLWCLCISIQPLFYLQPEPAKSSFSSGWRGEERSYELWFYMYMHKRVSCRSMPYYSLRDKHERQQLLPQAACRPWYR